MREAPAVRESIMSIRTLHTQEAAIRRLQRRLAASAVTSDSLCNLREF
jgi:hypothetical protein